MATPVFHPLAESRTAGRIIAAAGGLSPTPAMPRFVEPNRTTPLIGRFVVMRAAPVLSESGSAVKVTVLDPSGGTANAIVVTPLSDRTGTAFARPSSLKKATLPWTTSMGDGLLTMMEDVYSCP